MFATTGIAGNVGGELARNLLAANQPVRAVVRDLRKGKAWAERGCDLVSADINDAGALRSAFKSPEGVFVLVPPNFDPSPDSREERATADDSFEFSSVNLIAVFETRILLSGFASGRGEAGHR
jgi:NAD(P)H dehydrogenase (quinone)